MKTKYLFLMLGVAISAINPAFAMDNDSNKGSVLLVKPTQDRKDLASFDLHSNDNLTSIHSRLADLDTQTIKDEFGNEYDVYFAGNPQAVINYLQTPVDMRMPNDAPGDQLDTDRAIKGLLACYIKTHGSLMNKSLFYDGPRYSPTELRLTYSGGTYSYQAFDNSILTVELQTQKIVFKKKEKPGV